MAYTQLSSETIEGVVLTIELDTATGEFMVYHQEEWWKAPSLKVLREKLRKQLRQSAIAIPATLISGEDDDQLKITRITLTGQHAGNSNWLYTVDKTKTREQHRWGTIWREMTGAEIQELVRLYRAAKAAKETLRKYMESRELQVHDAYEAARVAATQTEQPKA